MYKCYKDMDTSLLEINPLVETNQGKMVDHDFRYNSAFNNHFLGVEELRSLLKSD